VVVGASIGCVELMRGVREVYHPWYARPGRFALMVVLAGIATGWSLFRLAAHLPSVLRLPRDGAFVWAPALSLWLALAGFMGWAAPRAAYLWVLPLLAASAPMAIGGVSRRVVGAASAASLAIASVLWLPDVASLLGFVVALLGAFPIVAPVWVLPALLLVPALTLVPPLVALLAASGWPRPRFVTRAVLVALALSAAWAYRAPAYTAEQPMRLGLLSLGDGDGPRDSSVLAVSGNEPVIDLGSDAPLLTPATSLPDLVAPFTGDAPFVSIGVTPELPPAGRLSCEAHPTASGEVEMAITVVPSAEGLHVRLELPDDIVPIRSNWPGVVRARWAAAYVAVPPEGTTFRLVLDAKDADRACQGRVLMLRPRPLDPSTGRVPRWIERAGVAWDFRVLDVAPLR